MSFLFNFQPFYLIANFGSLKINYFGVIFFHSLCCLSVWIFQSAPWPKSNPRTLQMCCPTPFSFEALLWRFSLVWFFPQWCIFLHYWCGLVHIFNWTCAPCRDQWHTLRSGTELRTNVIRQIAVSPGPVYHLENGIQLLVQFIIGRKPIFNCHPSKNNELILWRVLMFYRILRKILYFNNKVPHISRHREMSVTIHYSSGDLEA